MMTQRSGWGYRVDYDKEIAIDLQQIAQMDLLLRLYETLTDVERVDISSSHVAHVLMANPRARGPILGVSDQEIHELAWYLESWNFNKTLTMAGIDVTKDPEKGWYSRAEATCKRLEDLVGGTFLVANPKKARAKFVAALARHRRNKAKYG